MKRIISIQDISALGKCSLTVALPILSAMGVECAVVPTAVLSTHTQFQGFTFCDLTDEMEPIAAHWKSLGLRFDAVYTGYLGSFRQVDIVKSYFRDFGEGAKIIVDPAMADNGRLYAGFGPEFPQKMAELLEGADLVLPNLTEACFLLRSSRAARCSSTSSVTWRPADLPSCAARWPTGPRRSAAISATAPPSASTWNTVWRSVRWEPPAR